MLTAFFAGLKLSLGLILVIGPQNAFVLRQGLSQVHVLPIVLVCAVSDALLIFAGVAGIAAATALAPWLMPGLKWGGVAFLIWYGTRAFLAAWKGNQVLAVSASGQPQPLAPLVAAGLALTWLNPHVWLDTVVLIGSVAAQFPGAEWVFGMGAAAGSFVFFFTLGYGARILAPVFARPLAWRILDIGVGVLMFSVAWRLAAG